MANGITTIQIHEDVKEELAQFKEKSSESYEEIIIKLIKHIEKEKRQKRDLMIEGCKEMAEDSLKITKEWETTDSRLDWEW